MQTQNMTQTCNIKYVKNMLNNTNVSNPILLTNVFAADLWWSDLTILISKNDFR